MCEEKQELLHDYTNAVNTLLGHLRLQADAIVAGDPDFGRFDSFIEAAKANKKETGEAYGAHVSRHACGCPFNLAFTFDRTCGEQSTE